MRFLSICVIATCFATPAFAQDKGAFDGVRVEAVAGYSSQFDAKEVVYGGAIGYDFSTKGVVLGVDAGLTGTSGDRNGAGLRSSAGRDLNIGGRVGFTLAPKTLLYGKAGYANTRSYAESIRLGQTVRTNFTNSSAYVGGGLEQVIAGRAYLKGEYRYSTRSGDGRSQVLGGVGIRF